jgi:hypothetical protein
MNGLALPTKKQPNKSRGRFETRLHLPSWDDEDTWDINDDVLNKLIIKFNTNIFAF